MHPIGCNTPKNKQKPAAGPLILLNQIITWLLPGYTLRWFPFKKIIQIISKVTHIICCLEWAWLEIRKFYSITAWNNSKCQFLCVFFLLIVVISLHLVAYIFTSSSNHWSDFRRASKLEEHKKNKTVFSFCSQKLTLLLKSTKERSWKCWRSSQRIVTMNRGWMHLAWSTWIRRANKVPWAFLKTCYTWGLGGGGMSVSEEGKNQLQLGSSGYLQPSVQNIYIILLHSETYFCLKSSCHKKTLFYFLC